ncbi:hypothetical protein BO71DRAFT_440358 [Aspergillus ellipticus CBS 707.79]|uniref:Ig-like domain-containing protein n=1 Tax=Aspergillus ellipticus CBS 707.79 TaxID=1448320 RepID=A0A319DCZ4_9EURO|nr:hypothetical protein BO71DRAFT_440358 [Aspergillus ellipticus CBS 707.79]
MSNRFSFALACLLTLLLVATAQIAYNPQTNAVLCSKVNGSYCVHGSLAGSTIISCASKDTVEIRSCNILLSSILPEGYKQQATCYESSPTAGDALCVFNGTGYTAYRTTISVPDSTLCNEEDLWAYYSPQFAAAGTDNTSPPNEHDPGHEPGHSPDRGHSNDAQETATDFPLLPPQLPLPTPHTLLTLTSRSTAPSISSPVFVQSPRPLVSSSAHKRAEGIATTRVCSNPWAMPTAMQWLAASPPVALAPDLVVVPVTVGESGRSTAVDIAAAVDGGAGAGAAIGGTGGTAAHSPATPSRSTSTFTSTIYLSHMRSFVTSFTTVIDAPAATSSATKTGPGHLSTTTTVAMETGVTSNTSTSDCWDWRVGISGWSLMCALVGVGVFIVG